jgi:hypothetical protein
VSAIRTGPGVVNWSHPLNRGLVGWWLVPPGGSARGTQWDDLRGRFHATRTGAVWSSALGRPGGWGALSFDGTNDYATTGASTLFDLTVDHTVLCWARSTGFTNYDVLVDSQTTPDTGNAQYTIFFDAGGKLNTFLNDILTGATTLAVNTWYHIGVTFKASSTTTVLYVNGASDASSGVRTKPATTSTVVRFGARAAGNNDAAVLLDDMRIYSRALSGDEVRAVYTLSRTGYPGLVRRAAGTARRPPTAEAATAMLVHPGMHARMAEMTGRLVA